MLNRLLISLLFLMACSACAQSKAPTTTANNAPVTAENTPASANGAFRVGVDYEILPTPQPTYGSGKIEVAEVFSYRCSHCAQFQPFVNNWKETMSVDVRWEYVPAAFGKSWDDFARAYFAAEILGAQKKTHDAVFKALFIDQVKAGTLEEIADMYASFGVDRAKFLATMRSFGVTAKLNRARQFMLRTGVNATPTIIVNGKYRVNVTSDRGFDGMLATVTYLVGREQALAASAKK